MSASIALPLLRNLLEESLGYRSPQPHVPRLCGYVFEFSTSRWRHLGLTISM